MVNTILAKRVNHIVAKGDNPAWPKGSKSRGFSTCVQFVLSCMIGYFSSFLVSLVRKQGHVQVKQCRLPFLCYCELQRRGLSFPRCPCIKIEFCSCHFLAGILQVFLSNNTHKCALMCRKIIFLRQYTICRDTYDRLSDNI